MDVTSLGGGFKGKAGELCLSASNLTPVPCSHTAATKNIILKNRGSPF